MHACPIIFMHAFEQTGGLWPRILNALESLTTQFFMKIVLGMDQCGIYCRVQWSKSWASKP